MLDVLLNSQLTACFLKTLAKLSFNEIPWF